MSEWIRKTIQVPRPDCEVCGGSGWETEMKPDGNTEGFRCSRCGGYEYLLIDPRPPHAVRFVP